MGLNENLKRVLQLQDEIKQKYVELDKVKKEIIKEMVKSKDKDIVLENGLHATLVWTVENKIDYEKLQKNYEDVYTLGLRPTFSKTQALNAISAPTLNKILRDCSTTEMGYELKTHKEKTS